MTFCPYLLTLFEDDGCAARHMRSRARSRLRTASSVDDPGVVKVTAGVAAKWDGVGELYGLPVYMDETLVEPSVSKIGSLNSSVKRHTPRRGRRPRAPPQQEGKFQRAKSSSAGRTRGSISTGQAKDRAIKQPSSAFSSIRFAGSNSSL